MLVSVSERKVACTAVVNRLEKSVDFHAMIREKFWFHSSAGLGSFKSTLTRLYATHHSFSPPEPRQIKPRALGVILSTSKSRRLGCCNSGDVPPNPGSKDDTHSVHLLMFVFPRRLDQLSRFHRWVDLVLLFKKGVGREIAVLKVADNVFSNVQHSRNPVLKFCRQRTAGDLSQSTILRPELFLGGSVFAAWKRTLHCHDFVVIDGECYGRGRTRLTSRSFSATFSPAWLPRKTTSPSKRIKSSSLPQQSSHTLMRQTPGRLEGDRQVEGELFQIYHQGSYQPALQLFLS